MKSSIEQPGHAALDESVIRRPSVATDTNLLSRAGASSKRFLREQAILVALLAIGILLSFLSDAFLNPRNLSNLALQVTTIGIIAVGMTLVILIGQIDLSVGSVVGLSAIAVTLLMQAGLPWPLASLLTLVVSGAVVGLWNGFLVSKYGIPSFIITLGMMTVARGLALQLSGGSSVPVAQAGFAALGAAYIPVGVSVALIALVWGGVLASTLRGMRRNRQYGLETRVGDLVFQSVVITAAAGMALWVFGGYRGIPVPVAILGLAALVGTFVLHNTPFGRRLYAIGGNEQTARLSGVNVGRTQLLVFVVVTTLSALSGIVLSSRLNGASPNLGTMFELDAIAAVVIGGTSLSGGVGTVMGSLIGALIIGELNNGMSLLGVSSFYQLIVKGLIITLAAWFDAMGKKHRA